MSNLPDTAPLKRELLRLAAPAREHALENLAGVSSGSIENLHVDARDGDLVYQCTSERSVIADMRRRGVELPSVDPADRRRRRTTSVGIADEGIPLQANGVPLLHSNTAASKTIYLDFDGHQHTSDPDVGGFESFTAVP